MEKLSLDKFTDNKLENMKVVLGGKKGGTHYHTSTGKSGTDTYTDDNGSGDLDSGDTVTLDNGQQVCM